MGVVESVMNRSEVTGRGPAFGRLLTALHPFVPFTPFVACVAEAPGATFCHRPNGAGTSRVHSIRFDRPSSPLHRTQRTVSPLRFGVRHLPRLGSCPCPRGRHETFPGDRAEIPPPSRRSEMPGHRSCGALLAVVLAYAGGCSGGGGTGGSGGGGGGGGSTTATPDPVDSSPLTSTGTIAYVKGGELHLVEPDGSNDHVVWSTPPVQGAAYTVSGPSWRPDGTEIAFASDHELALSPNATDIYAIRPDGNALRKLTNGPTRARQLTFSKGAVTVTVSNGTFYSGPYWIILLGAAVKMEPSF